MSHVSGDPSVLAQRTFKGKITRTVMRNSTRRNSQRYSWPSGGKCWRLNDRRWCLKLHSGLFIPIYNGHIGDGLSLGWLHSISWHGKKLVWSSPSTQWPKKIRAEKNAEKLESEDLKCQTWVGSDFTGNASEDLWWIAQTIMPKRIRPHILYIYTLYQWRPFW